MTTLRSFSLSLYTDFPITVFSRDGSFGDQGFLNSYNLYESDFCDAHADWIVTSLYFLDGEVIVYIREL